MTGATVIQAVGSAHAFPMSRALPVTAVPPTSGILPVAMAASLVPATQVEREDPPAMRYGALLRTPGWMGPAVCFKSQGLTV